MKWNLFGFDWNAFKIHFMESFGFSEMNNDFVWTFEYASQASNRFDTFPQKFKQMNIRRISDTIRASGRLLRHVEVHIGFYSTKTDTYIYLQKVYNYEFAALQFRM